MLTFDSEEIRNYSLMDGKESYDYVLSADLTTLTLKRSDSQFYDIYGLFFSSSASSVRHLACIFAILLSNKNPSESSLKVFEQQITDFS